MVADFEMPYMPTEITRPAVPDVSMEDMQPLYRDLHESFGMTLLPRDVRSCLPSPRWAKSDVDKFAEILGDNNESAQIPCFELVVSVIVICSSITYHAKLSLLFQAGMEFSTVQPTRSVALQKSEEEILSVTAFTMLLRVTIRSTMKLLGWGDPNDAGVSCPACRAIIAASHPRGVSMSEFTKFFRDELRLRSLHDVLHELSKPHKGAVIGRANTHNTHARSTSTDADSAIAEEELLLRAEAFPPTRKPSFIGFPLVTPRPEYKSWFSKDESNGTGQKKELFDQSWNHTLPKPSRNKTTFATCEAIHRRPHTSRELKASLDEIAAPDEARVYLSETDLACLVNVWRRLGQEPPRTTLAVRPYFEQKNDVLRLLMDRAARGATCTFRAFLCVLLPEVRPSRIDFWCAEAAELFMSQSERDHVPQRSPIPSPTPPERVRGSTPASETREALEDAYVELLGCGLDPVAAALRALDRVRPNEDAHAEAETDAKAFLAEAGDG